MVWAERLMPRRGQLQAEERFSLPLRHIHSNYQAADRATMSAYIDVCMTD